jgi:ubiquinone/menaquinone biosynthesis C-methylase UbiE
MAAPTVHHPIFARVFPRLARRMERAGYAELRDRLLAGLEGQVIEVGAGNGMNFAHYPPGVANVLAVEPEPYLRNLARQSAADAPVPVEVVGGTADHLPAGDASVDAVVVSLVLCSVPDQASALAEARRVLRPGGELRIFEHVRADTPGLARAQRALDATVWPTLGGGCHLSRDTTGAVAAAGFTIERLDRLRVPDTPVPTPSAPHIIGVAIRPPEGP